MSESTTAPERLPIRPYARLLTMLGEQLIKNDRIALIELAKNSYDADATRVEIRFEGFGPQFETTLESRIVLLDNGEGMTPDVVRHHWLNPATSIKVQRKRTGRARTRGGRVIQGEKGIGRFAMFKLGSAVRMVTRSKDESSETMVDLDISFLDVPADLAMPERNVETAYLDELSASVHSREAEVFDGRSPEGLRSTHGTRIEVRDLRSAWSATALEALHQDLFRLQPLGGLLTGKAGDDPLAFDVKFLVNGEEPEFLEDPELLLETLIDRAVLRVVGDFDANTGEFSLTVNDDDQKVSLNSHEIRGLRLFTRTFGTTKSDVKFECGNFSFEFLFFDLRPSATTRFRLDPDERKLIKDHRIYLYRDNVRVLPYGDPEDDWLQLDVIRGTQGASRVFSNDQTLGFIYISQEENPELRDKTNREGLIDSGTAFRDFVLAIQLLVTHLRKTDFARYLAEAQQRDEAEKRRRAAGLQDKLRALAEETKESPKISALVGDLAKSYRVEHDFMSQRVARTEDLAGIGLSVETASHDVVAAANHALRDLRLLHEQIGHELGRANTLYGRAGAIVESLSFIVSRLQDVQGLFVSSRQRPQDLNVVQFIKKVESIYRRVLKDRGIEVRYVGDDKLHIKTVEAPLLQIFLNLMDNAVHWLTAARTPNPLIEVYVSNAEGCVIFSDNGPGINPEDEPYVFDAFFSAKGDEGRGLGLYIAREVAHRNGFEIRLVRPRDVRLPGANFRLQVREQ